MRVVVHAPLGVGHAHEALAAADVAGFAARRAAREAAGRLARWALANLEIDHVHASVATSNAASQAVVDRIASQPVPTVFNSPWDAMPLFTYRSGTPLTARVLGNRSDSSGTGVIGSGRADAGPTPTEAIE